MAEAIDGEQASVLPVGTNPDLAEFEGNEDIQTLATALEAWDQNMERDSAGALVWHGWLGTEDAEWGLHYSPHGWTFSNLLVCAWE